MKRTPIVFVAASLIVTFLAVQAPSGPPQAQQKEPESKDKSVFKALKYRLIGPWAGGRVSRSCGVPGDPLTYYVAGAASGVWKTTDGGVSFKPIFDNEIDSSIGAIAVALSDPNILYVGAGEANIRGNVVAGHGIYKSVDGGKTWKHVWRQKGQIGQIIVHPTNPDIAFAAVLGHAFGPNPERGVYRTRDGGKTWQQVLKRDADTGASDVCFDRTSRSARRRASRHCQPKSRVSSSSRPYSFLVASDSCSTSKASGASVCMRNASSNAWMRASSSGSFVPHRGCRRLIFWSMSSS